MHYDDNTVILTPNQRLSRYLQQNIEKRLAKTTRAFSTPLIFSIDHFLIHLYQTIIKPTDLRRLISPLEEKVLWQQHLEDEALYLHSDSFNLTNELIQAWKFLHFFEIPLHEFANYSQEDFQWFLKLVHRLQDTLSENKLITAAQLPEYIKDMPLYLPYKKIILFAIDEMPPVIDKLLRMLSEKYAFEIIAIDNEVALLSETLEQAKKMAHVVNTYSFNALEEEITQMALWAYDHALAGNTRIACIIPTLLMHRKQIQRIFNRIFYPNELFYTQELRPRYSLTGGDPLIDAPIIHIVLQILSMLSGTSFKFELFHDLFQSPYIKGGIEEQSSRHLFLAKIRNDIFTHVSLSELKSHLIKHHLSHDSLDIIQTLIQFTSKIHHKKPLKYWIEAISLLLKTIGWPGSRTLSSLEYQQIKKLMEIFEELGSLQTYSEPVSFHQTVTLLKKTLYEQIFQPQTVDANVQIMGVLEAAGQQFDKIWMMDLLDIHWPSMAKPNAFIPIDLQKAYQLPHCSPEKELAFAEKMHDRFLHSCQEIIFSFSKQANEVHQHPSAFIVDFLHDEFPKKNHTAFLMPSPTLEYPQESPIPITETLFPADSSLIKKTAQCHFQAFAHYRLKAKPLEKIYFKTNKKNRGILLHYLMEKFWQKYPSLDALTAVKETLEDVCLTETEKIVTEFYTGLSVEDPLFIALEIKRLSDLLLTWLGIELSRAPFRIHEIEKKHTIYIHQLQLNMRIDRIDEVENHQYLLLDYKTGIQTERAWFKEPFTEAQLPLYAMLLPDNIAGLAFINLHQDSINFKGIMINETPLPHSEKTNNIAHIINAFIEKNLNIHDAIKCSKSIQKDEFKVLQLAWKTVIEKTAENFLAGSYQTNPSDKSVCDFCQRQSLCRIYTKKGL
jgi:ATP-dependent helicase/nuclease subunit B